MKTNTTLGKSVMTISSPMEAELVISEDGIVTIEDKVTGELENKGTLIVNGKLVGDTENKGAITIYGKLIGDITNFGKLVIHGEVQGRVINGIEGIIQLEPSGQILGIEPVDNNGEIHLKGTILPLTNNNPTGTIFQQGGSLSGGINDLGTII